VLEGLLVDSLLVIDKQISRGDRSGDGGDLGAAVPVADFHGVFRQAEPGRPLSRDPHLRNAEGGRDMVVLHPGQVPDQPANRVGVGLDPECELVWGQVVDHLVDRFPDSAEGIC
jgi:hypothetical protein